MPDYEKIMQQRFKGSSHVMRQFPFARRYEFTNAIELADLADGLTVVDYPSGGGYVEPFIENDVDLLNFDVIEPFLVQGRDGLSKDKKFGDSDNKIPLAACSVDRLLSIAGIHHIANLKPFFNETYRILKPGGIFVIAEVLSGSPPARFLNEFVDRYSSSGHKGLFLDHNTCMLLRQCGFNNVSVRDKEYPWIFNNEQEMIDFCRGLFFLDLASDEIIRQGLNEYLGFRRSGSEVRLEWMLSFFQAFR